MKGQMTRLAIFFICIIVFEVLDWVFDVKSDSTKTAVIAFFITWSATLESKGVTK